MEDKYKNRLAIIGTICAWAGSLGLAAAIGGCNAREMDPTTAYVWAAIAGAGGAILMFVGIIAGLCSGTDT